VREGVPANERAEEATNSVSAGDSPTESAAPLTLTSVDRATYDATLANLQGKVVLVDFWATWCAPCVEQLPHTLELGRRLADRGLAVVTVSCDDPGEAERVAEFLAANKASVATNLISEFGGSPQSMDVFEISTGAVPYYKLYDRRGKLRQTFGIRPSAKKQYTAADIETAVERLLRE
jgi:thiol-disulfide isomerase/thioredoxin